MFLTPHQRHFCYFTSYKFLANLLHNTIMFNHTSYPSRNYESFSSSFSDSHLISAQLRSSITRLRLKTTRTYSIITYTLFTSFPIYVKPGSYDKDINIIRILEYQKNFYSLIIVYNHPIAAVLAAINICINYRYRRSHRYHNCRSASSYWRV